MKQCQNCFSQAKDTDLRCPSCGSIINKRSQPDRNYRFSQDIVTDNKSTKNSRILLSIIVILLVIMFASYMVFVSGTPKLSDYGFTQDETDPTQYSAMSGTYTYLLDTELDYLIIESKTKQSVEVYHLTADKNIITSKLYDTSDDALDVVGEFYLNHTYFYISSCVYLRVNGEEIFPYRFSQDMKPTVDLIKETTNDVLESFYNYLNNQDSDQIYISEFITLNK